jgi:hypothetical protein
MDPHQDREAQIGVGLLLGLAIFALVALASFYFQQPTQLTDTVRDRFAAHR